MIQYDRLKPLIHIHIPKTGGTSIRDIYKNWFSQGLLLHYFNGTKQKKPNKFNLEKLHTLNQPVCVYGHFNHKREFGTRDYYPEVNQFITILRDPFEKAISGYFFLRKQKDLWVDQSNIPKSNLLEYLQNHQGSKSIYNFFPYEVTMQNYKEIIETKFIEIGILEHLDESMQRIAKKLSFKYDSGSIPLLNTTNRDQRVPYEIKEEFRENNKLLYAIYEYVLSKYI